MEEGRSADEYARQCSEGDHSTGYTPLSSVADIQLINTPTEVDHYQIRRVIDIYVATKTEALQRVGARINNLLANTKTDRNTVHQGARRGGQHEPVLQGVRRRPAASPC